MRVLLVGVGTVGEAIARMASQREWCELLVLSDYDVARAEALQRELGDASRFPVETARRWSSWHAAIGWTW
jgi:malate/lactate dehydrogenase